MKNQTLVFALFVAAASSASAQTALNELRAAAGPAAVGESLRIGDVTIGIRIEPGERRDWPRDRDGRSYGDGREEAAQACGRVPFSDDRRACLEAVSRGRFFDRGAIAICSGLSFPSNVPECMSRITDKSYLPAEASICARESFDDDKIACLGSTGHPEWGNPDQHRSNDGREQAAEACAKAAFESDRRECIQAVGRAYFFDMGAVDVCSGLSFSPSYPKCMNAIADKEYLPEIVRVCARESFDDGKISCLQSSGRGPDRWPGWPDGRHPHRRR